MVSIENRVLLAPSINSSFFEECIFVVAENALGIDLQVGLSVSIPGETEEAHSDLRGKLCSYLQKALDIDSDWAISVEIEDTPKPMIVVDADDNPPMEDEFENLVLQAVRVFMAWRAMRTERRLFILSDRQLLVPLNFVYIDDLRRIVTLQLPKELKLSGSSGRKVNHSDTERYEEACSLLEEALVSMLQARSLDWRWKSLKLVAKSAGIALEVMFDEPPRSYELKEFERIVIAALQAYTHSSSVYSELLFKPLVQHSTEEY